FGSARTKGALNLSQIFRIYEPEYFLTFLSRAFSADLIGTDLEFTGPVNYFEVAFLSTSLLFFFALIYLIAKKKTRILTILLTLLAVLMLATPVASHLLTQATLSQRYSFLLIFGECAAIGFFAKDLFGGPDKKSLAAALIGMPAFAGLAFGLLYTLGGAFDIKINFSVLKYLLVFLAVYEAALLLLFFRCELRRFLAPGLALVLGAELILVLAPSLYNRRYLTKETFATSFFNDGTRGAVSEIQRDDQSLYRIETTTDFNFANEGQVDEFNSVHGYYNTNPQSILTLTNVFGATQLSTSYLLLGHQHYYLFTLLAGKYKVVDKEQTMTLNAIDEDLYEPLRDSYDCITFENKNALPFGYVYDTAYDGKTLYWTPAKDRLRLLANGYYISSWATPPGPVTDTEEVLGRLSQGESVDLFPSVSFVNDCTWEVTEDGNFKIHPTGPDPYLMFDVEGVEETGSHFLTISAEFNETNSYKMEYFVMTQRNPIPPDCQNNTFTLNTSTTSAAFLVPDDVLAVRIDVNTDEDVLLSALTLETLPTVSDDFAALKNNTKISDISLTNDTYRAHVVGNTDHSMLCVPILFTGRWSATVNGKPAQVLNINGGLCGIPLEEGENDVVMTYTLPFFSISVIISLVTAAVLLAVLIIWAARRKKAVGPAGTG
ncbi:MAG: YfhO family protein, partial [bacterium]